MKTPSERFFFWGMTLSMLLWGLSWTSVKVISPYGAAATIAQWRFAISFITMLPLLKLIHYPILLPPKALPGTALAAVFMATYGFCFVFGLNFGKAGLGGVLVTTLNPMLAYGIATLIVRKLPARKESAGLLLGLLGGAILIELHQSLHAVIDPANFFFLIASLIWAFLSRTTARVRKHCSAVTASLWIYALCTLYLAPFSTVQSHIDLWLATDFRFWFNMLFSASITTALATTFYFYATTRLGPEKSSSYLLLVPVFAALGAWGFLGETPKITTWIGGGLAICGLFLILSKKKPRPAPPSL
jgi:drug/metabolite transporter (DMT)-like permease